MLSALLLSIATPAALPDRDPTWLVVNGWHVQRADRACVALREPEGGGSAGLVSQPGRGNLLFLQRDDWGRGRQAKAFTLGWDDPWGAHNVLTVRDTLFDGPLGFGFYIDPIAMQAIRDARFSIYAGTKATGEPLASFAFPYFDYLLASTEQCAKALAMEVRPRRSLVSEGQAEPLVGPGALVSNDDYPPSALRAAAQGRVTFRLDIAEDGYPDACTVTASTAPESLSDWTCRLLRWRMRFIPRPGADGKPVRQSYSNAMNWLMPRD